MSKIPPSIIMVVSIGVVTLIFGLKPSGDNIFNLVGSLLGTACAVAGAIWATDFRERRRARALSEAVKVRYHALGALVVKLPLLLSGGESCSSDAVHAGQKSLLKASESIEDECRKFGSFLESLSEIFVEHGAEAVLIQSIILQGVESIGTISGKLKERLSSIPGHAPVAADDLSSVVSELLKLDKHIDQQIPKLGRV